MKENVGTADRITRGIVAPALVVLGYFRLRGNEGRSAGLVALVGGALLAESAVTAVCPLNALLGIDTRKKKRFNLA